LSDFDVETLTSSRALALWFEEAARLSKDPKKAANWVLGELLAALNAKEITIDEAGITPAHIAELANAVHDSAITSKQAKDVFAAMFESKKMPSEIIAALGLRVESDAAALEKYIDETLAENPAAVESLRGGKSNVFGWLMGQVMKKSGGKANPEAARELLRKKL
jgi:aspartyl-tRNA(Asn)/glutamyl-tRNA(Gln) amidotransferase subunit B